MRIDSKLCNHGRHGRHGKDRRHGTATIPRTGQAEGTEYTERKEDSELQPSRARDRRKTLKALNFD